MPQFMKAGVSGRDRMVLFLSINLNERRKKNIMGDPEISPVMRYLSALVRVFTESCLQTFRHRPMLADLD